MQVFLATAVSNAWWLIKVSAVIEAFKFVWRFVF